MPSAGFEPVIPLSEALQAYAIERAVTGIGVFTALTRINFALFPAFSASEAGLII
jgi:hypothetical protein